MSVESNSGDSNNTRIIVIVLVILGLCCLIPVCVIALLTLLGPQIGDVFSDIVDELEAAVYVGRMLF
jgi:hypothetical protein